ncbi:MAG: site-2 protease family protein [Raoultibacter sp.]
MDIVLMVIYITIVLSVLVFIHEGGHYLVARAFGVRVTEFMLGLPGPRIGFTWRGTKFGITAIPLGGYAKVCGMEVGEQSPHLEQVSTYAYAHGTVLMEDVARDLGITDEEAFSALDELSEWGTLCPPDRKDEYNTYRTPALRGSFEEGSVRVLDDPHAFFESEARQQYRFLPFWKRSLILLAGPAMNLLFAMIVFVIIYSLVGFDMQNPTTGEMQHITVDPFRAVVAGFSYIGAVIGAVVGLFNPMTAAETVSQSTSLMGMAVLSKTAAEQGAVNFVSFMAMISVSLGIMNMLPIPPLDGGRFVVEIYQKIRRKFISYKALNYLSMVGIVLFMGLFIVMLNQDIQRFIFGNWG